MDVNAQNGDGVSALDMAGAENQLACVKLLVDAKANPDKPNAEDGLSSLHCAVGSDYVEIAAFLIDNGADINKQSTQAGLTPLMKAVMHNHPQSVKLLLERKAITSVRATGGAYQGKTAIDLANELKREDIAALLRAAAAQNGDSKSVSALWVVLL